MEEQVKKKPNAQKWTLEKVKAHLDRLEKDMQGEYCYFLGSALKKQGLQRHVWGYWKKLFSNNDDIMERMLFIEGFFEAKIFEAGLLNKLPVTIVNRTLICVHGWKDR